MSYSNLYEDRDPYTVIDEDVNVERIIEELTKHSFFDNEEHVHLQTRYEPNYDLEYTNTLLKKYKMYSTRMMCLTPTRCYSYHVDSSPRVHIPLITNEMCFFILEKQMFNLPVGKSYWIDTRKGHTALNGSNPRRQPNFKRWHLVGMTDEIL